MNRVAYLIRLGDQRRLVGSLVSMELFLGKTQVIRLVASETSVVPLGFSSR